MKLWSRFLWPLQPAVMSACSAAHWMNPLYNCHHTIKKTSFVCLCVRQMRVVCKRTVLNTLRNPQTSYAQLALNIFFAVLVGLIYYQIPMTLPEALQNRYCMHNLRHNRQPGFSFCSILNSAQSSLCKCVTFLQFTSGPSYKGPT